MGNQVIAIFLAIIMVMIPVNTTGIYLRGEEDSNEISTPYNKKNVTEASDPADHRMLTAKEESIKDFEPLNCNKQLSTTLCSSWVEKFGQKIVHSKPVTIKCGECIRMDHPGPLLSLAAGMNIQGKLVMQGDIDTSLTIRSPFIFVQGELQIDTASKRRIDGSFMYKFEMIPGNEDLLYPIDNNKDACKGEGCWVGNKVIAVAGGKLNGKLRAAPEILLILIEVTMTNQRYSSLILFFILQFMVFQIRLLHGYHSIMLFHLFQLGSLFLIFKALLIYLCSKTPSRTSGLLEQKSLLLHTLMIGKIKLSELL